MGVGREAIFGREQSTFDGLEVIELDVLGMI